MLPFMHWRVLHDVKAKGEDELATTTSDYILCTYIMNILYVLSFNSCKDTVKIEIKISLNYYI
jgi:hypothetical protein